MAVGQTARLALELILDDFRFSAHHLLRLDWRLLWYFIARLCRTFCIEPRTSCRWKWRVRLGTSRNPCLEQVGPTNIRTHKNT